MNKAKNPVRSVENTIRILETLKSHDAAGVTQIADELDITKGTAHNHLSTLLEHGFVVKEEDQYQVGIRLFEFGEYIRNRKRIYKVGAPEVDNLAEQTEELGSLLIQEQGRGIYLYRARGDQALKLDTGVGARVHLHNTALGKSILAKLPTERVEEIIDRHGLPGTTENTITDRDTLFEELDDIRERGVAFDREERVSGVRCIAAPVETNDNEVLGSVSIAGPVSRMKGTRFNEQLPEVVQNASKVIGINATYV